MIDIEDTPAGDRILMIASRYSRTAWNAECESVRQWLATSPSELSSARVDEMLRLINAALPDEAYPLAIIHCYCDVPSGTEYHIAFDLKDSNANESTLAEVMFGVVASRHVESTLGRGWHQTAVLRFPQGLPKLFDRLPIDAVSSACFGLCDRADFQEIRRSGAIG